MLLRGLRFGVTAWCPWGGSASICQTGIEEFSGTSHDSDDMTHRWIGREPPAADETRTAALTKPAATDGVVYA